MPQARARLVAARAGPSESGGGAGGFNVSEAAAIASLDALIDSLLAAKSDEAMTQLVTANVLSFDVKFFLRVAARADTASERDKASLTSLAQRTMRMMDTIVAQTQRQMSSSQEVLSAIVRAAADEGTGAFVLPLREDRLAAVRKVLGEHTVDEAVISNAYAWMRKANDDGLDGMVVVIQRVLQLWAGRELCRAPAGAAPDAPAEALLQRVMASTEEAWDELLHGAGAAGATEAGLSTALQQRMEAVVLGLPNGSYAQRVQAEYLKELERRVKAAFGKA